MPAESSFALEILTLQKVFLRQNVRFVVAPGREGLFEILPGHAPYLFALRPGLMHLRLPDGTDRHVAVGDGVLVVHENRATAVVRTAENREAVDVERAGPAAGKRAGGS